MAQFIDGEAGRARKRLARKRPALFDDDDDDDDDGDDVGLATDDDDNEEIQPEAPGEFEEFIDDSDDLGDDATGPAPYGVVAPHRVVIQTTARQLIGGFSAIAQYPRGFLGDGGVHTDVVVRLAFRVPPRTKPGLFAKRSGAGPWCEDAGRCADVHLYLEIPGGAA